MELLTQRSEIGTTNDNKEDLQAINPNSKPLWAPKATRTPVVKSRSLPFQAVHRVGDVERERSKREKTQCTSDNATYKAELLLGTLRVASRAQIETDSARV